ncbi:hypothetical protein AQUCO_01400761v1 [Aquilegia coerulea]|uniref:Uncharacterized protein n=1 Tax=Aquilegia coerulea TaxID=218851 RepID=A0A2G5DXV8_AQUCA|nr:hypothetical protein AQUCO_01400761v1 [Aquilegia coerulea]
MEVVEEEEDVLPEISSKSDICETLMERYSKSSATQHQHLCASACAMKSILQEEKLPLTPLTYFFATISAINDAIDSLDSDSIAPLSSFLIILNPLLPSQSLSKHKAVDAVNVLVLLLKEGEGGKGKGLVVSTATLRCVVQCLGSLILLCDLEDWGKIKVPFKTILRFSIDKRPKVRRCAQVCVEKLFKLLPRGSVKEASKVVLSLFKSYMPRAMELNDGKFVDGSKREVLSKPEYLEVVHMINLLKLIVPYLSKKVSQKILSELCKLLTCQFSTVTRHLFSVLEVLFQTSEADVIVPEAENIIVTLASYVSTGEKNPMDTVMSASSLLKNIMGKLHGVEPNMCTRKLPLVFESIAGLLVFDIYNSQAASILKDIINKHMDGTTFRVSEYQIENEKFMATAESLAIKAICAVSESMLCISDEMPNEHTLAVLSILFLKLGKVSYIFMKSILLKLANLMRLEERDLTEKKFLQECIGSAVMAMGPEKMLTLVPVSLDSEKCVCSNFWLVPILNKYVAGASLEYFLDHIVPLVESLQKTSEKVKKSSLRKDLQACIRALWGLLPAFCRYPTDTHKCFEPLAKVLIVFLKEDGHLCENIALSLQALVRQNRSIHLSKQSLSGSVQDSNTYNVDESKGEVRVVPLHYSREVATRNIQALASCSTDLLQALTDVFFDSPPEKRTYIKEAISCMASITDSSKVKNLFISSLDKLKLVNAEDECAGENEKKEDEEAAKRSMLMEFAYSLIPGAEEDLLDTIFNYIRPTLQGTVGVGQSEAYYTLSRIFEGPAWRDSSRLVEMIDLLLSIKSPVDIMTLRSRFSCLHKLLVYMLKGNEEPRKAAYDVLLNISDSLNDSSAATSDSPHQQLFNMIMGYLSGAPPPIMSAAVAALSLLIYKNSGFCFSVPELVPSVLILLQSKAKEVIKAVLGFVKVLVSCIQATDLQNLLPDILNGILPWSSVSKNHFRSKVVTIFEIIIRKCGYASVELLVPDKYRGFIKTVKEQRNSQPSSKDTETSDAVPKPAFSFQKGDNKRKRRFGSQAEGTDSRGSTATRMDGVNKRPKFNKPGTIVPNKFSGIGKRSQMPHKAKSSNSGITEDSMGGSRHQSKGRTKRPFTGKKDKLRQRR